MSPQAQNPLSSLACDGVKSEARIVNIADKAKLGLERPNVLQILQIAESAIGNLSRCCEVHESVTFRECIAHGSHLVSVDQNVPRGQHGHLDRLQRQRQQPV